MTHSFALPLPGPITGSLLYLLDPYVNGYTDEEGVWYEPVDVDDTYIPLATEATGLYRIGKGLFLYVAAANMALNEVEKEPNQRNWYWCHLIRDVGTAYVVDGVGKIIFPPTLSAKL